MPGDDQAGAGQPGGQTDRTDGPQLGGPAALVGGPRGRRRRARRHQQAQLLHGAAGHLHPRAGGGVTGARLDAVRARLQLDGAVGRGLRPPSSIDGDGGVL
ncbi:MAG: hypothetical protein WKG00_29960 [Polyangiaceae bacterium]